MFVPVAFFFLHPVSFDCEIESACIDEARSLVLEVLSGRREKKVCESADVLQDLTNFGCLVGCRLSVSLCKRWAELTGEIKASSSLPRS
mmetsp:Transcript_15532/g.52056  ORF Transcript_15532/g.52056 Transcript_15532/m.52056 type:complete len:89 (-) Transcript_15532:77-343(-)